ncbi:hypothetical protein GCM10009765_43550 [Fodinicola feengrottensis]|uniref:Uncharacterized protein n=1 Tax=Fodinicola feengrottensis TaxID=435914 RepID=A0ABP4TKL6_9ACTN
MLADRRDTTWPQLLAAPGALAWRASADRRLVDVLTALADSGMTEPGWRVVDAYPPPDFDGEPYFFQTGSEFIVLLGSRRRYEPKFWTALQYSPGAFRLPVGWSVDNVRGVDGSFGAERIRQFCSLLAEHGSVPWRPAAAAKLADRTGLNAVEAALLLAGLPDPVDVRGRLGLSAADAAAASRSLSRRAKLAVDAVLQAAIPKELEQLWTAGPDVSAAADEWIRRFGRRTPVDIDTLSSAYDARVSLTSIDALASEKVGRDQFDRAACPSWSRRSAGWPISCRPVLRCAVGCTCGRTRLARRPRNVA